MNFLTEFSLGSTFVVAELSGNHNGRLENALAIVESAKQAGADAVKLQTYRPDTITLDSDHADFRVESESPWSDFGTLWSLYERAHTPWEWHPAIFDLCRDLGLICFSSPFDESAVDFLETLDSPFYKIASPEINHIPLIEKVAKTGKPVILSSGLASLEDINLALETLRGLGSSQIVLLKCTSAYPTPAEDANLSSIQDIATQFGVLPGFSDHTEGSLASAIAVAFGAVLVEKHFIGDLKEPGVDSFFSLDTSAFKKMVDDIRVTEKLLGGRGFSLPKSAQMGLSGRRSIYFSRALLPGDMITESDIKVVRPHHGLHPKFFKDLIGRRLKKNVEVGDRVSWDVLEND